MSDGTVTSFNHGPISVSAETEMGPWLNEVTVPSLILTGEQDGGCNPRLNLQIDAVMENSKLVILPKYKHSLLLEAGDVVATTSPASSNRECLYLGKITSFEFSITASI